MCVCVCAALPAGPGLPGGPANGCMKEDHACNWNIRICIHTVNCRMYLVTVVGHRQEVENNRTQNEWCVHMEVRIW